MPTTNPRIQVTLAKSTHKALSALAKRHRRSMSSLASEVLDDMLPLMEQALKVAASIRKLSPEEQAARKNQMDLWTGDAERRLSELEQGEIPSDGPQDANSLPLEATGQADGQEAAAAGRRSGRPSTPTRPNRGVKTRA